MNRAIQTGVLVLAVSLAGWQFHRLSQLRRDRKLAETQLEELNGRFESRGAVLADQEQRNRELVEAERRAGNESLLVLMRERAAATKSSKVAESPRDVGNAFANAVDNPEQRTMEREQVRKRVTAGSAVFLKLLHLSPDEGNGSRYIALKADNESRNAERVTALLRGTISLDDALLQRDAEADEYERQIHETLGEEGYAFLQSIADDMRGKEAKRLVGLIQQNLDANNALSQEQSDRLQKLVQQEIKQTHIDNTDLFRTPDDWARVVGDHQANVLKGAAAFLTPTQLNTMQTLADIDLAMQKENMILKRKSLGIK